MVFPVKKDLQTRHVLDDGSLERLSIEIRLYKPLAVQIASGSLKSKVKA